MTKPWLTWSDYLTPLVSVIVPAYNAAAYIEKTVENLSRQTCSEIEIILVDDGSTDGTAEICDRLSELYDRVKVIHQENKGVSAARNAGMRAASGSYIGFCDSDDVPDSDLYETLLNLAVENNAELSMVDVRIQNIDGSIKHTSTQISHCFNSPDEFAEAFFTEYLNVGVYTKLFSRELAARLEFPEGIRINEDMYFFFCAGISSKKTVHKNVEKYTYALNSESATMKGFSESYFDKIFIADEFVRLTKEKFPKLLNYAESKKVSMLLRLINRMLVLGGDKQFPDRYKEICKTVTSYKTGFCKRYLNKKDFARFMLLKANRPVFEAASKRLDK